MPLKVREGYINPLTMMKKKTDDPGIKSPLMLKKEDSESQLAKLRNEKQAVQNKMILVTATSSNGEVPEEVQKSMEKQLEEISSELTTAESETIRNGDILSSASQKPEYDRYEKNPADSVGLSAGLYLMGKDENGKKQVIYKPFQDR